MAKSAKPDLSKLPMHIRKTSKHWFYDSKTAKRIHVSQIENHLPKEEPILKSPVEDWTRSYYGNT